MVVVVVQTVEQPDVQLTHWGQQEVLHLMVIVRIV